MPQKDLMKYLLDVLQTIGGIEQVFTPMLVFSSTLICRQTGN
jgi:hypothetical protein